MVYIARFYDHMNHMVLLFLFKGKSVLVPIVAVCWEQNKGGPWGRRRRKRGLRPARVPVL